MTFNKFLQSTLLTGLLAIFSSAQAFEFRAPLTLEHGPLRLLSEEEDSSYGMRYWSAVYNRDAQKAFSDHHGTRTQDVAALLLHSGATESGTKPFDEGFEFRTTQMFQDWYVPEKSELYNPLLRTAKLRLSARYSEMGAVVGAVWDMPVVKNGGRLGFRTSISAKKIKVTKIDNEGVRQGAELQDVLSVQEGVNAFLLGGSTENPKSRVILIRSDFAEALVQSGDRNSALRLAPTGQPTGTVLLAGNEHQQFAAGGAGGTEYPTLNGTLLTIGPLGIPGSAQEASRRVAVIHSPEGVIPRADDTGLIFVKASNANASSLQTADDLKKLAKGESAIFVLGNDYSSLAETGDLSLSTRKSMQDTKAGLWLAPIIVRDIDGASATISTADDGVMQSTTESGVLQVMKNLSEQVTENAYEWMHDRGVDFESYTREGFADLDFDLFYNHTFNDKIGAEAFVGFKAPTGGRNKYHRNPYKVNLGNGGHWEVKAGGMATWTPNTMFGLKAQGYYSFVLSDLEERHATFKNSTIKLGPKVDADVKWDYFLGSVDLNISHFSAKDITGLIGYQIYYKRHDKVTFKESRVESWLKGIYNSADKTFSTNTMELDHLLSEANTNSISHRLRCEASFIMTDWLEFFAGGAWSFAGRNTLRSTDAHVGFNVAF